MNDTVSSPESRAGASSTAVDDLFDALSASRRRTVLQILRERADSMDVLALSRAVAARERDDNGTTVAESAVQEVHVTLHHVHLPKLDEAGFIEHDREERTVSPTVGADETPIGVE